MLKEIRDFIVEAYSFPNCFLDLYIRLINWTSIFCILLPFMQGGQGVYFIGAFLSAPVMSYAFIALIAIAILEPIIVKLFWAPLYTKGPQLTKMAGFVEDHFNKLLRNIQAGESVEQYCI